MHPQGYVSKQHMVTAQKMHLFLLGLLLPTILEPERVENYTTDENTHTHRWGREILKQQL